jgi:hypothetical protein
MIVYELACSHGHRFEGWFASSDAYAEQRGRALVTCPVCDDAAVDRVPSARVSVSKGAPPAPAAQPAVTPTPAPDVAASLPADVLAVLRDMVKRTENVGRAFAEEARKIHYDEAPARPIRGQASTEEAQELREEGIDCASLPPFLLPDQH